MITHNLSRKQILRRVRTHFPIGRGTAGLPAWTLRRVAALVGAAALLFAFLPPVRAEAPTLMTYQGRLKSAGVPQNGTFAMTFDIFDVPT